ncbi:MAG: hypothetical protein ACRYGP_32890 [Janthinobacterium lividum]
MPFTFNRHPKWSSALTLQRIDARIRLVSERRAQIARNIELLKTEALDIDVFVPELSRLRDIE